MFFCRFKPNHDDPSNDFYADEIYTPTDFSEDETDKKATEKRSPIQVYSENEWPHNFGQGTSKATTRSPLFADKETLIQELLKTAQDTQKLFEGLQDDAERYPDENVCNIFLFH
ncbi:uncharacterized protein CEXT_355651 [Caerostris extrusa]|uniref:Uncharacterized protein n=1 Tax=Caerostris extrusa TaxID=172846 RepID=A0AAV4SCT5_CAEEX|nr:uncharacterized protein CEXT_355651 [Caerostris extrusa]